ncbi:hypothetical protein T08_9217 [Trichinella sp. T8]|nr:hypothetical protein T08_9217 [Trichinella sp. T8]
MFIFCAITDGKLGCSSGGKVYQMLKTKKYIFFMFHFEMTNSHYYDEGCSAISATLLYTVFTWRFRGVF